MPEIDAVVVGAGFAGLYQLFRLRNAGVSVRCLEAGGGVGGTWYWNRYPGARCDVESLEYSYGFDEALQQEWEWTERYASQPEILAYLEHVTDRFGLRELITFNARVLSAQFEESTCRWRVATATGEVVMARYLIMATGCLSAANVPDIPGRDDFRGDWHHTGRWPHTDVDFSGRRVGVIGTGSSGVQCIPVIASRADEVVVFQRSPTYSIPAHNRKLESDEIAAVKADYQELRRRNRRAFGGFGSRGRPAGGSIFEATAEERSEEFQTRWDEGGLTFLAAYSDLLLSEEANAVAASFVRAKIRELVNDNDLAERLTPEQRIGCKRLCIDSGYYDTFNQPHVRLVDIRSNPIDAIAPFGVVAGGDLTEVDNLVFATGFDAMTGALTRIDIRGRDGRALRDEWGAGPRTYLGLSVPGFPNMFIVAGPGSPSVLTNMVTCIEYHVEWITECVGYVGDRTIEASPQAADDWVAYVNSVAAMTLFPSCNSWYLGANIPGKPRVFMPLPGFPPYADHCADVAADGYRGFSIS